MAEGYLAGPVAAGRAWQRQRAHPSVQAALETARQDSAVAWDYALAVDPVTLAPVGPEHRGETLVVLAGYVEGTRLLDAAVVSVTAALVNAPVGLAREWFREDW